MISSGNISSVSSKKLLTAPRIIWANLAVVAIENWAVRNAIN